MVPAWAPDGALLFISDRSGWWNLYREDAPGRAAALCAREAEFGGPAWVFGSRPFQVLPDGRCALPARTIQYQSLRRLGCRDCLRVQMGCSGCCRTLVRTHDLRCTQVMYQSGGLQAAGDVLGPQGGRHAAGRAGPRFRRPERPCHAVLRVRAAVGGAAPRWLHRARARRGPAHAAQRGRAAGGIEHLQHIIGSRKLQIRTCGSIYALSCHRAGAAGRTPCVRRYHPHSGLHMHVLS